MMKDTVELFRKWCGDDKYAKFVKALQTTGKREGRLVFWQEAIWSKFLNENQLSLPQTFEGVAEIFSCISEIEPEFEYVLQPQGDEYPPDIEGLKVEMMRWATKRRASGLDLQATLILRASATCHDLVSDQIGRSLWDDPELSEMFDGATISTTIKPLTEDLPSRGVTVHVSKTEPPVALAWGLAERKPKKPWWKVW